MRKVNEDDSESFSSSENTIISLIEDLARNEKTVNQLNRNAITRRLSINRINFNEVHFENLFYLSTT